MKKPLKGRAIRDLSGRSYGSARACMTPTSTGAGSTRFGSFPLSCLGTYRSMATPQKFHRSRHRADFTDGISIPRVCNPWGLITPPMQLLHRRLRGGSRDSNGERLPRAYRLAPLFARRGRAAPSYLFQRICRHVRFPGFRPHKSARLFSSRLISLMEAWAVKGGQ